MGQSYYISDALNLANKSFSRLTEDTSAVFIANAAIRHMWMRYDWRETQKDLPPFYLIPMEQDYGKPFYGVPTDFLGLRLCYLTQLTSAPPQKWEMKVIKNVRRDHIQGIPSVIGYAPEAKSIRVYPRPPQNMGSAQFLVSGIYKTVPPQVTSSTLQSTLIPWDDLYFEVFVAALKWAGKNAADDPQAEKKLQELNFMLEGMAANEGLELGDPVIAPAEPLVGGTPTGFFPGLITGFV